MLLHTCRFANLQRPRSQRTSGARARQRQAQRVAQDHAFARLFPNLPAWRGLPGGDNTTLAALEEIAEARRGAVDEPPAGGQPGIPAGYTYLGQLVVHDLTFTKTTRPDFPKVGMGAGTVLANLRSPRLDLDCVYGDGSDIDGYLYERPEVGQSARYLLRLGEAAGNAARPGEPPALDLPRITETDADGRTVARDPLIADVRNDQHLILSQLTLLFMRLHNRVAELARAGRLPLMGGSASAEAAFNIAHKLVVTAYRNIVFGDHLARLVDPRFAADLRNPNPVLLVPGNAALAQAAQAGEARIATEFAVAGARAGHAMTRNLYRINPTFVSEPPRRLLRFSSLAAVPELPVPREWQVDWSSFFEIAGSRPQRARRFTPFYAPDLIDRRFKAQFDLGGPIKPRSDAASLSLLDLYRCWTTVPSGQQCAGALPGAVQAIRGFRVLGAKNPDEMLPGSFRHRQNPYQMESLERALRQHPEFLQDTPLSYYVLQEAAVLGDNGAHLGPLGSYIVAMSALLALQSSYFAEHGRPRPPGLPLVGPGLSSMPALIRALRASDRALGEIVGETVQQ